LAEAGLRRYVASFGYLRAMTANAVRINLAGDASGVVGAEHAAQAAARLAGQKLRLKRRREAQRTQPVKPAPNPAPVPAVPKRISLGDLRVAALAR
jgi:sRNA-binding protein